MNRSIFFRIGWRIGQVLEAVKVCRRPREIHVYLNGNFAGTKDDLAKTITTAIRDAVRRGQLPKNVLTSL